MGFESDSYVYSNASLIDKFLTNAIDQDMTVYQAYYWATYYAFDSDVTAAVIFDTEEQKNNDHLWGEGVVMPDEYPDDNDYWHYSWNCED